MQSSVRSHWQIIIKCKLFYHELLPLNLKINNGLLAWAWIGIAKESNNLFYWIRDDMSKGSYSYNCKQLFHCIKEQPPQLEFELRTTWKKY